MFKTAFFLFATIVATTGCKKSTTDPNPSPNNSDTTTRYIGEVKYNVINGEDLSAKSILKTSDNDFLVTGSKMLQGPNPWLDPYPAFFKISSDLQVKLSKIPLTNDAATINQAVETSDGYYLLGQIQGDVTQTRFDNLLLIKTDKNGSVLWKKQYSNITYVYSIVKTSDDHLAILAYNSASWLPNYINDNAPTVLLKIDMEGNVVFRKDYIQEGLHYASTDLVETSSGYAFIAYTRAFDSTTTSELVAQFCKTDNAGNITSKTELEGFNIQYMRATHLAKKADGGFIVSHFPSQIGGTNGGTTSNYNSYLYYLDEEGNRIHLANLYEGGNYGNAMWDVVGIKQSDDGSVYVLAVNIVSAYEWAITMKR